MNIRCVRVYWWVYWWVSGCILMVTEGCEHTVCGKWVYLWVSGCDDRVAC